MSAQNTVGIAAISCGKRIRNVLESLLPQDPRLKLVAAYDPLPLSVETLQAETKTTPKVYADWREILNDPKVDWVVVGSPNCFHAEQAIAALEAGKHVFCEKPLATSFKDCLRLRDAVAQSNHHFFFGLVLRYSPHYQKMHRMLEEGKLGELISFEFNETLGFAHGGYIFGNWRRDTSQAGSHILEKTCHDLDLANWMANSLPVRVASFGGKRVFLPKNKDLVKLVGENPDGDHPFRKWPDPNAVDPSSGDADIFDHQVVILEYANGVRASFHTNAVTAKPERRFYLCGTHGTLTADVRNQSFAYTPMSHKPQTSDMTSKGGEDTTSPGHGGGDEVMAKHLANTMLKDAPPLAGIREGLESAIVSFAIDEAADTGTVVDLKPYWKKAGINLDE